MELITLCMMFAVVIGPLMFFPMKLMDGFILPQIGLTAFGVGLATICFSRGGVFPIDFIAVLAIVYLFYLFLTQFWSTVPHNSLRDLPLIFSYLVGFVICLVIFRERELLNAVAMAVCLSATFNAIYGILQKYRIDPIFPERLVSMKDMYGEKPMSEISKWFRNKNYVDSRPIGTIGNTTFFAGYLSASLPFVVYLSLAVSHWFWICFAVVIVGIHVSECRAAYLGLIASAIMFFIIIGQRGLLLDFSKWLWGLDSFKVLSFLVGLVAVIGIIKFFRRYRRSNIGKRLANENDPLCYMLDTENEDQEDFIAHLKYRFRYWKAGIELIRQRPLFGFGLRTYRKEVYQAQAKLHDKDGKFLGPCYHMPKPREVHNDYIENFVEGGLIGGLLFLLIMGVVVNNVRIYLNTIPDIQSFILVAAILSAFVCIAINAFFFFPIRLGPSSLLFFLALAMMEAITTDIQVMAFTPSWIITLVIIASFIALLYEGVWKPNIGNYYFLKFLFLGDSELKEFSLLKAMEYCPKETIFLDRAIQGYSAGFPDLAERYADRMLLSYDGMTPAWTMFYNVAMAKLGVKNLTQAFKYFQDSAYYYPRFKLPFEQLVNIWPLIPLPRRRILMKKITEEGNAQLNALMNEMDKVNLSIEVTILREKVKLGIPEDWGFDMQTRQFLTPEEVAQVQKQRQKQQEDGQGIFAPQM